MLNCKKFREYTQYIPWPAGIAHFLKLPLSWVQKQIGTCEKLPQRRIESKSASFHAGAHIVERLLKDSCTHGPYVLFPPPTRYTEQTLICYTGRKKNKREVRKTYILAWLAGGGEGTNRNKGTKSLGFFHYIICRLLNTHGRTWRSKAANP